MAETRLVVDSLVKQNPAVLSAEVGDAVVLLHAERNAYFDTDSVGAEVWRLIVSPVAVSEICRSLEAIYEVEPGTCQAEVLSFLEDALNEGIIQVDG